MGQRSHNNDTSSVMPSDCATLCNFCKSLYVPKYFCSTSVFLSCFLYKEFCPPVIPVCVHSSYFGIILPLLPLHVRRALLFCLRTTPVPTPSAMVMPPMSRIFFCQQRQPACLPRRSHPWPTLSTEDRRRSGGFLLQGRLENEGKSGVLCGR